MKPNIMARANIPYKNPSGRIYFHSAGMESFENVKISPDVRNLFDTEKYPLIAKAYTHLREVYESLIFKGIPIRRNDDKKDKFDYLIAIAWGNNGEKIIDFIGYWGLRKEGFIKNWPTNPEIYTWITKNGVIVSDKENPFPGVKNIFCGDGAIILGEEEKYRRACKNEWEYSKNPPKINGLELAIDFEGN